MGKIYSGKYLDNEVEYQVSVYAIINEDEDIWSKFMNYSVEGYTLFTPSIHLVAENEDELDEDELKMLKNGYIEFKSESIKN